MSTAVPPASDAVVRGRRQRFAPLSWRRRLAGWALAAVGPLALTAGFLGSGTGTDATTLNFLCHLTVVVFVAILGGWWPAVATALLSTMVLNWFFTPPTGQWLIHEPLNVVALCLFLLVAAGVARVVDIEARRTSEAVRARRQAAVLFELAGGVISEGLSVPALLGRLRRTYDLRSVALVAGQRGSADGSWEVVAASGRSTRGPSACDRTLVVDDRHLLLVDGTAREPSDDSVMEAFAARIAGVLQQQDLAEARLQAQELAAGNAMRTALLAAVSHDLRTPLAGIKASASSLRMEDVEFSEEDTRDLLATIEESADQLTERIEDLLDMSRIQSGELVVHQVPLDVEDLVGAAIHSTGGDPAGRRRIRVEVPAEVPAVLGDHGLLVRVVANLLENALKYSRDDVVVVRAGAGEIRVVDRGPGVPPGEREEIFRPFQRLGDRDGTTGVGLGLAVARGLAEGMGGSVRAEETPGGGLTMVLSLPTAEGPSVDPGPAAAPSSGTGGHA
ncbi:ATP-binding protein [Zhihengliuella sp.]|uniref:sensor histidine kinase n=1 Tax=Zhihengliuella sp. TaxID=1954483 RepID=UPI002812779B|nr:ATP-binding protein [Zhihengliuella sp.]